jgi:hypothetical protein
MKHRNGNENLRMESPNFTDSAGVRQSIRERENKDAMECEKVLQTTR